MRWEDERYVRLYTRDTPEFLALSWIARGLFALILRKVDRAGVLEVGRLGLKGVAVAVGAPWADIEAPLAELLTDGCVVFEAETNLLGVKNFLIAQECSQSDKARKRASRERAAAMMGLSQSAAEAARSLGDSATRRRLEAKAAGVGCVYFVGAIDGDRVKIGFTEGAPEDRLQVLQVGCPIRLTVRHSMPGTLADESALHEQFADLRLDGEWFLLQGDLATIVTNRDVMASRSVTQRHDRSHAVTRGHSASLLTHAVLNPSLEETRPLPAPPADGSAEPPSPSSTSSAPSSRTDATPPGRGPESPTATALEREVFEHWVAGWKRIVGGTRPPRLDDKRRGKIRARLREQFTAEDLKQAVDGVWASEFHINGKHYDIELVCRDAPHVERFMALAPPRRAPAPTPKEPESTEPPVDAAQVALLLEDLSMKRRTA